MQTRSGHSGWEVALVHTILFKAPAPCAFPGPECGARNSNPVTPAHRPAAGLPKVIGTQDIRTNVGPRRCLALSVSPLPQLQAQPKRRFLPHEGAPGLRPR